MFATKDFSVLLTNFGKIAALGYGTVTVDIAKSGYTPIGFLTFLYDTGSVALYDFFFTDNNTNAKISLRNITNSQINLSSGRYMQFRVLYQKN